jgi:hypothetical protein
VLEFARCFIEGDVGPDVVLLLLTLARTVVSRSRPGLGAMQHAPQGIGLLFIQGWHGARVPTLEISSEDSINLGVVQLVPDLIAVLDAFPSRTGRGAFALSTTTATGCRSASSPVVGRGASSTTSTGPSPVSSSCWPPVCWSRLSSQELR